MKRFSLQITPTFFITAAGIGYLFLRSFTLTLLSVAMIFLAVLVHEMGHACVALLFGQKVRVELTAFGGVTTPYGAKLSLGKEFLMVFMGPFFGFLFFIGATIASDIPIVNPLIRGFVQNFRFLTLFWTVMNLLPILPLDGGHLLRIVLEPFLRFKARIVTLYVSVVFATIASVIFFLLGLFWFFMGGMFLIFALQGVETLRRLKNYSQADEDESNQRALQEAEHLLESSQEEKAITSLEKLSEKTRGGLIYTVAKQYLAKIYFDHNQFQKAYQELLPIEKDVSPEAKCILYLSSFAVGDYKKVVTLSKECFKEKKTAEIALYAAFSHGLLTNLTEALSWLKVASSFQGVDLEETAQNQAFDSIRDEKAFQDFVFQVTDGIRFPVL